MSLRDILFNAEGKWLHLLVSRLFLSKCRLPDTTACSFDNGHSAKRTPFPVRAKYGDPYHRDAVLITPKSYHKNLNSKTSSKQRDDSIIRVNQGAKNG